ncbi:glycosyltransferase family 4 protein [Nonomuraea sp. NPDC050310]|uniref:glycosyltransferase family 4 protein n=1 Tax=Nonomuraea sp. NPDC050310 TaxID=3154935 RepID=UPI0033FE586B
MVFVVGTSAGGTGTHVRMLAEGLVRRGIQVVVAGPRSTEEAYGYSQVGARFAEVAISDRPHPVNDLRTLAALRRIVREADLVHAHGLRAGALAGLARSSGVPLVVTLHNALTAGGAIGAVYGVLERVVARRADLVLGVSPDLEARMTALGARRVAAAVVPAPALRPPTRPRAEVRAELEATAATSLPRATAVPRSAEEAEPSVHPDLSHPDLSHSDPSHSDPSHPDPSHALPDSRDPAVGRAQPSSTDRRAQTDSRAQPYTAEGAPEGVGDEVAAWQGEGGAGGRAVVLTVGRLAQQKGLELLLDVAAGPWPPGVEPLFVVAGEGPLRGVLQERIDREKLPVSLIGARQDIPDLLAAADVVLWASRWEGQPLSLSEALKAGRPVVATAVGGIPALMGGAGLLVPYGDAQAMRTAVLEALKDGERLAAAAAARGRELPDDAAAVAAALQAYGEMA